MELLAPSAASSPPRLPTALGARALAALVVNLIVRFAPAGGATAQGGPPGDLGQAAEVAVVGGCAPSRRTATAALAWLCEK